MWRKTFDVLFWLAVAVYFGGMLTLGVIAAPAIFSTAHDAKLTMPGIAAPPLDMGNQVGGEVFGVILNRFAYVEWACVAVILIALFGWFRFQRPVGYAVWVTALLWAGLAGVVAYDSIFVRRAVFAQRDVVRQAALAASTTPAVPTPAGTTSAPATVASNAAASGPASTTGNAAPVESPALAKAQADFDTLHKESEDLGRYKVYLLLGMILVASVYGGGSNAAARAEQPAPSSPAQKKRRREPLDP